MPKKKAPTYDIKPSGSAHPSLSSSSKPKNARSIGSNKNSSGNSVNDRLQQLRISQGVSPSLQGSQSGQLLSQALATGSGPSLPPSLRSILQLPDAPPPRPRPGLRVTGRTRGPAGPAPPHSWLETREQATEQRPKHGQTLIGGTSAKTEKLPGSFLPEHGSLIHTALKALAVNWDWHVHYDQFYLATMPVRCKEALLSYMSHHSLGGMDKAGLDVLFVDDTELEDATGVDGLTHLDLSGSIGYCLKLKELKNLLRAKKTVSSGERTSDMVPESWDTPNLLESPSGLPKFHSLTHLSLSNPNKAVTWKELLDLAPCLSTITHLSLAYWPSPTISPNSATAYRETPQGNVNFGAGNFYSSFDNDWTEAASILRRLSRSTYCLKWLDLTGCFPWVQALGCDQVDWCGAWRALETVKVGQGYIPGCFQENAAETAWRDVYSGGVCLHCIELLDMSDKASREKRQLADWARVESATLEMEDSVNTKISKSMTKSSIVDVQEPQSESERPGVGEDFDGWTKTATAVSSFGGSRSERVTFERGWDAWWMRDAIRQIRDAPAVEFSPF